MIAVTASVKGAPTKWLKDMEANGFSVEDDTLGWYKNFPDNIGLVGAYQKLYEDQREAHEVIAFSHDDVTIHEPWAQAIAHEFHMDPKVAIVGLGGAKGIGVADIYKTPYQIQQLQRIEYRSNQTDYEIHGARETGACDVAVVDGFFMAVRTSFLDQIGGWKWFPHRFHMYDVALCLMAHRHGWKVRIVGVNCTHWGGGTSTTADYVQDCRDRGTSVEREHTEPHTWCYNEFRDMLPLRIK